MKKLNFIIVFVFLILIKGIAQDGNKEGGASGTGTSVSPYTVPLALTCDCNPKVVLSTIVIKNDQAQITIPKTANYTLQIILPKDINIAEVSKTAAITLIGSDGKEIDANFNEKGQAKFSNLQPGTYAAKVKPPKGGSGTSRCPPFHWYIKGQCVPVDKDIKTTALNAVDINCPSGKYDANGNCIFASQTPTNVAQKTAIKIGTNVDYHIGSSSIKNSTSPFLFFKNGQSVGIDFTIVPPKGTTRFKIAVDYITGTSDENEIKTYAKQKDIVFTSYKFTKPNPSGFSIMASPQFMLFPKSQNKKLPLMWLDLKAGAVFNNQQNLQFFQSQTTPSKEVKSNAVSFVYSPSLIVNVVKTKKLFINLKTGYSSFGGFGFGVNITEQVCVGAPCFRCQGAGCTGEFPKKSEK